MGKEVKINELENRQSKLNDNSDIIYEMINNRIMLDILNWGDDSKLSETALRFKHGNKIVKI